LFEATSCDRFFQIIFILDLYVFNIVYKVGIKQYSSEMASQTGQVILTFAAILESEMATVAIYIYMDRNVF
jgi:hypothetical protein